MKKKLSGYVIRRELVAGSLHRAALAVIMAGWFLAAKLHGVAEIIIAVLCGAVSVGIIVECVFRAERLAREAAEKTGEHSSPLRKTAGDLTGEHSSPLRKTAEELRGEGATGAKSSAHGEPDKRDRETVIIPKEFYATAGRKPAQRGRKKSK